MGLEYHVIKIKTMDLWANNLYKCLHNHYFDTLIEPILRNKMI